VTPAAENAAEVARVPQAIERLSGSGGSRARCPTLRYRSSQPVLNNRSRNDELPLGRDTLRHVGTVFTRCCGASPKRLSAWNSARIEQHRPAYRSALLSLGLSTADVPAGVDKVANALTRHWPTSAESGFSMAIMSPPSASIHQRSRGRRTCRCACRSNVYR